jgi:hypothetical protein
MPQKPGEPTIVTEITPEDRAAAHREKACLRSERWRRAHGIGPRKPAQKPWLAEGISRSRQVASASSSGI